MATLLVGFDSAWTAARSGAIAGVLRQEDGEYRELGEPASAIFGQAEEIIADWQARCCPDSTIVLIDQPTIVNNRTGQRPVENLVGSSVSLRYGGMQPANQGRESMFGSDGPLWRFLDCFGGAWDPSRHAGDTLVIETYPVLTMIALGWTLPDSRAAGRLPKYNPALRQKFSITDWQHVCRQVSSEFERRGLQGLSRWSDAAGRDEKPRKADQDRLDACICLVAALYLSEQRPCLMVGDQPTGYIVVPYGEMLCAEMERRAEATERRASDWVRVFRLDGAAQPHVAG